MTKLELIKILEEYPDDIEIWIDDAGYGEGGQRLEKVEKQYAWEASLDGDSIDDEWIYSEKDLSTWSKHRLKTQSDKYHLIDNGKVYSKEVLILYGL